MRNDAVQHSDQQHMSDEFTSHLSRQEYEVLVNKATDRPGNGGYTNFFEDGVYHCRACGAALYKSDAKFHSDCGWPSFDTEIQGSVNRIRDNSHGMVRVEIVCANCGGHLGHVFEGERYTATNTRHCVNTSSIVFHPKNTMIAYLGMGDFHSAQALLHKLNGVLYTEVGYAHDDGSSTPTYQSVQSGSVSATEVVKVEFDPAALSLDSLLHFYCAHKPVFLGQKQQQAATILATDDRELHQMKKVLDSIPQGSTGIALMLLQHYAKAEPEHQHYLLKQERQK